MIVCELDNPIDETEHNVDNQRKPDPMKETNRDGEELYATIEKRLLSRAKSEKQRSIFRAKFQAAVALSEQKKHD